jgi:hypothetical protein
MKTGRPKIEIDFAEVDKLCQIQCTGEEIASFFEISYDTLERRCKEQFKVSFAEYIKEKSAKGKSSLRRLQWKAAMNGNVTMLIWLGKQYLGQTDKTNYVDESSYNDNKEALRDKLVKELKSDISD